MNGALRVKFLLFLKLIHDELNNPQMNRKPAVNTC